jgi:regulator of protease activity HflC (stomatin/prohibitin superfamily)
MTEPQPVHHGTLQEWMDHNPRAVGLARLTIATWLVIALSIIGTLIGSQQIDTATDLNGCVYQSEDANTSSTGQTAVAGSAFGITWKIRNTGSCTTWGKGVALVSRSDTIHSDQTIYAIQFRAEGGINILSVVTTMKAPDQPGTYDTAWQMQAPSGQAFGPVMTRRVLVYPAGQPAPNPPLNFGLVDYLSQVLRTISSLILYAFPAVLALRTVMWRGASFLQSVYQLKTPPMKHISAMLFGGSVGHARARGTKIDYYEFDPMDEEPGVKVNSVANPAAELIGGPLWVTAADRTAILTERGAKFGRVLGAGVHLLRPHERVRAVVDLQIQQRRLRERALTKDGIPLELDLDLAFRISEQDIPGEAPPPPPPPIGPQARIRMLLHLPLSPTLLEATKKHQFSREAVRRIVYETVIMSPDIPPDWTRSFGIVRGGDITDQLAALRLDDLSSPEDPDIHPLNAIVENGLVSARGAGGPLGIDVLAMEIGIVEPSADIKANVAEQRIGNWMIEWKRRAHILEAEGNAIAMQALEEARAEAQATMIQSLIESFQIATAGDSKISSDVIAMRFIDALETLMQTKADRTEQEDNAEEEPQPDQSAKTILIARQGRKE